MKWIFRLVVVVAFLALAGWSALQWFQAAEARGVSRAQGAWIGFLRAAAVEGCLGAEAFRTAAAARAWAVAEIDPATLPKVHLDQDPADVSRALRVAARPTMPFAKEDGVTLRFDDRGCLIGPRPRSAR